MLIYAALENAVLTRLRQAVQSGGIGYRVPEIESYGGQLDDEAWYGAMRRLPAIWVIVGGDKVTEIIGQSVTEREASLAVMVATRNVRGERETRHGDALMPGTYRMVEDVSRLLAFQDFGLPLSPLSPARVQSLYNIRQGAEARSVYAVEFDFEFRWPQDGLIDISELADFKTFDAQYDLEPFEDRAEHDQWLQEPPDHETSAPDLSDQLKLRE